MDHSRQRAAVPGIALLLDLGGSLDGVPPRFPALLAAKSPLQVRTQEAQLVRSRQDRRIAETGVQAGHVLLAPDPGKPTIGSDADQIDEPDALRGEQDVARLEITMRELPQMHGAHQSRNLVNAVAQQAAARAVGEGGQVSQKSMQIHRAGDLLHEQVAFARKEAVAAMKDGERPGGRQTALAQAVAVDPGAQRRRTPRQRLPGLAAAGDAEALVDDAADFAVHTDIQLRNGGAA